MNIETFIHGHVKYVCEQQDAVISGCLRRLLGHVPSEAQIVANGRCIDQSGAKTYYWKDVPLVTFYQPKLTNMEAWPGTSGVGKPYEIELKYQTHIEPLYLSSK